MLQWGHAVIGVDTTCMSERTRLSLPSFNGATP